MPGREGKEVPGSEEAATWVPPARGPAAEQDGSSRAAARCPLPPGAVGASGPAPVGPPRLYAPGEGREGARAEAAGPRDRAALGAG